MSTSKLIPNDPRVTLRSAHLNGHTYGYIHMAAHPAAPPRGTVILIHGFPDISFGWRNQIPYLSSLGLEVIALDCLGYGRSDAPPSSDLQAYTQRGASDAIATLCAQLGLRSIILGGHDWGGSVVYRTTLFHPHLVRATFSVCTPFPAPTPTYTPLAVLVRSSLPNFAYQLHLASGQVETHVRSPRDIRQLLSAAYGGRGPDGEVAFSVASGVDFARLPLTGPSPLLAGPELDFYVQEWSRHGVNGPLNWYRTRELNYVHDLDFFFDGDPDPTTEKARRGVRIEGVEVLFVQAMRDEALKPFMARRMGESVERLTWERIEDAGHWVLWQRPEKVNEILGRWLTEKVFGKEDGEGEEGEGRSRL